MKCTEPGCDRNAHSSGFCRAHYGARWRRERDARTERESVFERREKYTLIALQMLTAQVDFGAWEMLARNSVAIADQVIAALDGAKP